MDDTTTLGAYLRAERERRDFALKTISETTKVSLPLLEGLESDDISRWPGGIFRRAFVRSYAEAVGLDPDDIYKRFERQHRSQTADGPFTEVGQPPADVVALAQAAGVFRGRGSFSTSSIKARYLGTAADMAVAMILAFGSAAAGSRLLWPVLAIAAYYAAGILLTGTSPMVALLGETVSNSGAPLGRTPPPDAPSVNGVDTMLGHSSPRTIS